jgi:predicted metalloendopeptidase
MSSRWLLAALAGTAVAISVGATPTRPRPQDDFYGSVNSTWLATTRIPPSLPWISPFVVNYQKVQARLALIVSDLATHPDDDPDTRRISDLYDSFMDVSRLEKQGLAPLSGELARIDALHSRDELPSLLAHMNRYHFAIVDDVYSGTTPLYNFVGRDPEAAGRSIVSIRSAGLGMRSRYAYLDPAQDAARRREEYRAHIERTLQLAGDLKPKPEAEEILEFETRLAAAQASPEQAADPTRTPVRMTAAQIHQRSPGFDWPAYLAASHLEGEGATLLADPGYVSAVAKLAAEEPLATWRAYLRWQLLRHYSPYLGSEFVSEDFKYYGAVESGLKSLRPRAERGILLVRYAFPMQLGRIYVARYVSPSDRTEVEAMVAAIKQQYRIALTNSEWLQPSTRAEAIAKLDKMTTKVGYPDVWPKSNVAINRGDLIGDLMRLSAARYDDAVMRLTAPADRGRWLLEPFTTLAYYDETANEIVVPAGVMLWPWFDRRLDSAWNYGGIGTTIAHEIGHAFDDRGSYIDADGRRRDWWTPHDRAEFVRRTARLIRQYDDFAVGGRRVNGTLTLSENIADLSGLTLAWRAYRSQARAETLHPPSLLAGDRRFFTSFATHWRAEYSDALLDRILKTDGHAPQQFRANGPLRNFAPFREAFAVRPGDRMYLSPDESVSLW